MSAVYKAIAAVAGELAKTGIAKDRKNAQQGYNFRGIDDMYNTLAPLLSQHGLVILPRVTDRTCVERQTRNGGALFYTTVAVEFDFVAVEDGSKHTVTTFGEAMDSGDKSTNKAMSAAYKYAVMQAFAIPTEGDNDADATTHEVAAKKDSGPVSDAQARDLRDAAEQFGADIKKLCTYLKVDSLAQVPANDFDDVMKLIMSKRKKAA